MKNNIMDFFGIKEMKDSKQARKLMEKDFEKRLESLTKTIKY